MTRRSFRTQLRYLLHPRAYHEEAGTTQRQLLSVGQVQFFVVLIGFYAAVLVLFGLGTGDLETDPVDILIASGVVFVFVFPAATAVLLGYFGLVSRQSITKTIPRHLFGHVVYVIPLVLSVIQLNNLIPSWDRFYFGAILLRGPGQLIIGLRTGDVSVVPGALSITLFSMFVVGNLLGAILFFYYDSRYHHYLNRVEAIIPVVLIQAMVWYAIVASQPINALAGGL